MVYTKKRKEAEKRGDEATVARVGYNSLSLSLSVYPHLSPPSLFSHPIENKSSVTITCKEGYVVRGDDTVTSYSFFFGFTSWKRHMTSS